MIEWRKTFDSYSEYWQIYIQTMAVFSTYTTKVTPLLGLSVNISVNVQLRKHATLLIIFSVSVLLGLDCTTEASQLEKFT